MITITSGTPDIPPWWVGQQVTCPTCNAVLQFETGDAKYETFFPSVPRMVTKCPNCAETLTLMRSDPVDVITSLSATQMQSQRNLGKVVG
jgi:C4-type Zn-finger protein